MQTKEAIFTLRGVCFTNSPFDSLWFLFSSRLQINAVSLFLLYLVEMISSGLQIIYNTDEV